MAERSSKKQQELLEFIDSFIKEHGYGPSYREVMNGLGYRSVSTVAVHVHGLLAKGYIRKKDNSARSIEIVTMQLPTATKNSGQVAWLEDEINRLIVEGSLTDEDTEALVKAAELLGSANVKELRSLHNS